MSALAIVGLTALGGVGALARHLTVVAVAERSGDQFPVGTLVVNVVENPVINRIAFEGNKRVEDATLQAEVSLRPRVVFTRSKVQNDVKRILDVYRVNGRFAATVEPKIIQLEQNRADLVFELKPAAGISK